MIATALYTNNANGSEKNAFNFRQALKDRFERRQRELGISDYQLLRSFCIRSIPGALLALRRFHRDGFIDERMRTLLQRRLGISDGEFSSLLGRFFPEAYADRDCFFGNLGLFLKRSNEILKLPAYSNVGFYGASVPEQRGNSQVSVGELLSLYKNGEWVIRYGLGMAFVYKLSGEFSDDIMLAEAMTADGRVARVTIHNAQALMKAYLNTHAGFCMGQSSWTVRSLVRMLRGESGVSF